MIIATRGTVGAGSLTVLYAALINGIRYGGARGWGAAGCRRPVVEWASMSPPPPRTAPSRTPPSRAGLGRAGRDPDAPTYRLLRTTPPVAARLVPDEAQREVLDH